MVCSKKLPFPQEMTHITSPASPLYLPLTTLPRLLRHFSKKEGTKVACCQRTTEADHLEEAAGTHIWVHTGEEEHRPPGLSLSVKSPVTGSRQSGVSQTYHPLWQLTHFSYFTPLLQTALRQLASGCIPQRPGFGKCRRCLKTSSS